MFLYSAQDFVKVSLGLSQLKTIEGGRGKFVRGSSIKNGIHCWRYSIVRVVFSHFSNFPSPPHHRYLTWIALSHTDIMPIYILSIVHFSRLRAKLGLKPLDVPSSKKEGIDSELFFIIYTILSRPTSGALVVQET